MHNYVKKNQALALHMYVYSCVEYISGFMVPSHPALYDLIITFKISGSG